MIKKCPKCGYQRQSSDVAPDWQCPSCGVAYAKVSKPQDKVAASPVDAEQSMSEELPKRSESNMLIRLSSEPVKLIGIGFVCLIVGYFGGREHLKYELKQAFTSVADEVVSNTSTIFSSNKDEAKREKYTPDKKRQEPFSASLIDKGFTESDFVKGRHSDAITFTVDFTNLTGKSVRAFDGVLTFTDMLGNKIFGATMAINDPVQPYTIKRWSGGVEYNQFIARDRRFKSADFENLKIIFETNKILFEDGTTKIY